MKQKTQRKKYVRKSDLSQHEQNIESLFNAAEKEATLKVTNIGKAGELRPGSGGRTYFHCFRTEFFHKAMNRLAVEGGFRSF